MKAGAGDWSASANFCVDAERTQVAPHAPQAKDIVYLISRATFEPNGIIDLMNLQSSEVGALPGDYVGCTGLDNLGTWQVTRDGKRSSWKIRVEGNKLTVVRSGMVISVR